MTDILDIPCTVDEVWHRPELGCCTPLFPCERAGAVQTIPARVRDAVELAGRSGRVDERRVAVWLVEGSVGGEGA